VVLASDAKGGVQVGKCRRLVGHTCEVRANRVDARLVNHVGKRDLTIEMSCPWISDREKNSEEKTMKFGPLRRSLPSRRS